MMDCSLESASSSDDTIKQLKSSNKSLRHERDQLGKEYDEIKAQFERVEAEKAELENDNNELKVRVRSLLQSNEDNSQLRKSVVSLQKENEQLKIDVARLRGGNRLLHEENEKLRIEHEEVVCERESQAAQLKELHQLFYEINEKYEAEVKGRIMAKEAIDRQAKGQAEEMACLKKQVLQLEVELRTARAKNGTDWISNSKKQANIETGQQFHPPSSEEESDGAGKEGGSLAKLKGLSLGHILALVLLLIVVIAWLSYRVHVYMEDDGVFTLFGELPSLLKPDYSYGPR